MVIDIWDLIEPFSGSGHAEKTVLQERRVHDRVNFVLRECRKIILFFTLFFAQSTKTH